MSDYKVQSINHSEKLPSKQINCLFQDQEGYIWIGTTNGLCRYDGYNIKGYKSSYLTPGLLSDNNILSIQEDRNHRLWVGTIHGINILDKRTGKIEQISKDKLSGNHIWTFLYTKDGTMWVGTTNGLHRYSEKENTFFVFLHESNNPKSIPGNDIRCLYEDSRGNIWIGTWGHGICRYDKTNNTFISYPPIYPNNRISTFYEDNHGRLWVGAWGDGVHLIKNPEKPSKTAYVRYDPITPRERVIHSISKGPEESLLIGTSLGLGLLTTTQEHSFYHSSDQEPIADIPNYEINYILQNKDGNTWLATRENGLFLMFEAKNPFNNYAFKSIQDFNQPLSILALYEWDKDELLLGINKIGAAKYNKKTKQLTHYLDDPDLKKIGHFPGNIQYFFKHPQKEELWLGSEYCGLLVCTLQGNKITHCRQFYPFAGSWLTGDVVKYITSDKDHNIWIGTNNGINIITTTGDTLSYIGLNQGYKTDIQAIKRDYRGDMWIATNSNGVFKANTSRGIRNLEFKNYSIENGRMNANEIKCIYEDSHHVLWVGSKGGSLNKYNRKKNCFELPSCMKEIPGDAIFSITETNDLLYLGTNQGLVEFNPRGKNESFIKVYTMNDGILNDAFNQNSVLRLANGDVCFGTPNGFLEFNPMVNTSLMHPSSHRKVVITDIKIFHNSFDKLSEKQKEKLCSNGDPLYTKSIVLSHNDYNFGVEFSCLEYRNPEKSRYSYKLEGFDQDWHRVNADQRFAYYTNLKAGNYRFLVKGTDENGVMIEEPTIFIIQVLPPWYATWWAYGVYTLLLSIIAFFFYRYFRYKIRMNQALRLEQLERSKSEEVAQTKLHFFTNITHELLTPLTIINCSVEELVKNNGSETKIFRVMKNNISRLNRLLAQILEFRKAESGNLRLSVSFGDIGAFITQICRESFGAMSQYKKIELSIVCDPEHIPAWFDKDKIDKIVYNLLSNAFKYNEENGRIKIEIKPEEPVGEFEYKFLNISVGNTGKGIASEHLKSIFDRFYEINYTDNNSRGNGIGLSLTRNLVELHKGKISVKSVPNEWTEFRIQIRIDRTAFQKELIENSPDETEIASLPEKMEDLSRERENENCQEQPYSVLIIEDDSDLLDLIQNLLSPRFTIFIATNGIDGIESAQRNNPQIILSDIMMPGMNGFDVCKNIKMNENTCHIPIVLLSAKISHTDKLEGFNTGADAYITKPFNYELLEAQLISIVQNRSLSAVRFRKTSLIGNVHMNMSSIDEKIISEAIKAVERNIENPNFDLEAFTTAMGMSNSMLYRKLKSLTNLSPSEFIKNIRLKTACRLLIEKKGNISEVAYMVGFNDAKYFSVCFKKEFYMTPMEYIEQNRSQQSSEPTNISNIYKT